jgi:hypothetical protein
MEYPMCDFSLENVASRPAVVADRLVTTTFAGTITRGFASPGDIHTAVCLRPGTEIAFDRHIHTRSPISSKRRRGKWLGSVRSI